MLNVFKKCSGAHFIIVKDTDDSNKYKAINTKIGSMTTNSTDCGALLNTIKAGFVDGSTIEFLGGDTYVGTTDFTTPAVVRLQFIGNGASLSGWKIKITGSTSQNAKHAKIDGFKFTGANSGIVINNTEHTKVENCYFNLCTVGVSIESDVEWSELWSIKHCEFMNCQTGVKFKTPTGTGTGSYVNGLLQQCTWDAFAGTVVTPYIHIDVQSGAETNEGVFDDLRLWFNSDNGIGLNKAGDLVRCSLRRMYFESFIDSPSSLVAIKEVNTSDSAIYFQDYPIIEGSGAFSTKYDNSLDHWIQGYGMIHADEQAPAIGVSNTYGPISSFDSGVASSVPRIYYRFGGTFSSETVTVEIRLVALGGDSTTITKASSATASNTELTLADYITLASLRTYWIKTSIEVRAKTTKSSTNATVTVGIIST